MYKKRNEINNEQRTSGRDMDIETLDKSLIDSLGDSQIIDSAADAAEQALDSLLSDGIIKDIPILGHAAKLWRGGIQLRSYLFARKLLRFLAPLNEIPQETRENFLKDLESDPKQRRRVGEHLLLLLERMDDLEKPEILSKAFCAYVAGSINYDTFRQVGFAIDHSSLSDLLTLRGQIDFHANFYDEGIGAHVYKNRSDACVSRLVAAGVLFYERNGIILTDIGARLKGIIKK